MLIKIIVVGKLKDRALRVRCEDFATWLKPYAKIEERVLPDSDVTREGVAIIKELERDRGAALLVLSEEGREYSSVAFAELLGSFDRKMIFVIGGPYGLAAPVKARADLLWSLSKLTFTHEIARLLLYEQLYRAVNICHGRAYHKP
jgi:23S rRNA (pseudouridine1915-N3)-methyltransferase